MADPLAYTPQAPQQTQGQGFLGIPQSMWQNLANFGANTAVAANARTPQGFLEYGTSPAGALGEGMIETEQQNKAMAQQQAEQGLIAAQTQSTQMNTIMNELHIPQLEFMNRLYSSPDALNNFINGGSMPGGPAGNGIDQTPSSGGMVGGPGPTSGGLVGGPPGASSPSQQAGGWATPAGTTPGAPGSEGTGPLGNAISTLESGNDPSKVNSGGFSGAFQFGASALQSAGLYKPAPGEDVTKNTWGGTFSIPGYGEMSYPQFMANPQAQAAAFNVDQSYLWKVAQTNHMDAAIGQTVGNTQITQAGLLAGMHFAGPGGMQQFLMSGGRYDPADSNGTHLSQYISKVDQAVQLQRNFDPSRMADPSDVPGPLIPAEGVTPGKAQQMIPALTAKIERMAMLGLPTTALQSQLDMYSKMATAPYGNVDIRAGGAAGIGGNLYKMATPSQLYGAGNAAMPAAEYGGLSENGQPIQPTTIEPAQIQGQPGGVAPAGGGQAGAPAAPAQGAFFDAAVMGAPLPAASAGNGAMYAKPLPFTEETVEAGVKKLDDLQDQADENAQSAEQTSAQIASLKFEGAGINKDNFAPYIQDIRKTMLSVGHLFNQPDSNMQNLANTAGNVAALQKNTMTLTANVTHQFSSRPAVVEMQMLATAQPNLTMPNGGYRIVTDQLAGLAQYQIARSQAFSKWHGALTQTDPGTQIQQMNQSFDAQFNQRITPMAFIAHQWMQSPEGQQYLGQYLQYLKGLGAPGTAEIGRLRNQLAYGDQAGLFNSSAGGGQ